MTALTTGIGLVPIVIGGHLPGKELLFPIATVMLGGLTTSSILEFTIRPGLFLWLSRKDAQRLAHDPELDDVMASAAEKAAAV
jgi:HME family heavy-metal exporter